MRKAFFFQNHPLENSKISSIQAYSTSQKSLNKRLTSGRVLRLRPPTHRAQFAMRSSTFVRVHLCSSTFVCVRLCASACVFVSPCVSASRAVHIMLNFLPIMLFRNSSKDYLLCFTFTPLCLSLIPLCWSKIILKH